MNRTNSIISFKRKMFSLIAVNTSSKIIYLKSLIFSKLFLAFILFVLFKLYTTLLGSMKIFENFSVKMLLYYVVITESIEFSKIRIYTTISEEIKDGSCAYNLLRPISYLIYHFFSSIGVMALNFAISLLIGIFVATILTGIDFTIILHIFTALPLILLAMLLNFGIMLIIGLLAFYIEEVTPIYWVYQKILFIAGGFFIPIEFFPLWLQKIVIYLPTTYIAYAPAKAAVMHDSGFYLTTLIVQALYCFFIVIISLLIYNHGIKKVQVNGG